MGQTWLHLSKEILSEVIEPDSVLFKVWLEVLTIFV